MCVARGIGRIAFGLAPQDTPRGPCAGARVDKVVGARPARQPPFRGEKAVGESLRHEQAINAFEYAIWHLGSAFARWRRDNEAAHRRDREAAQKENRLPRIRRTWPLRLGRPPGHRGTVGRSVPHPGL